MQTDLHAICCDLLKDRWISDIHVTVGDVVRIRRSGMLENYEAGVVDETRMKQFLRDLHPKLLEDPEKAILIAEERRDENYSRCGLDFSAQINTSRCRCNLSYANSGRLSVVLRRLDDAVPSLQSLEIPKSVHEQILRPTGLVLVTGPTGSGKSTTLAAMLDHINRSKKKHILTIEDPVEYLVEPIQCKITRKEVGTDAPNFLSALRAAMRQDPDVIMVGEIRDLETMRAALAAAETGHLVLTSLHTNSAAKTVDRVSSFFPTNEKEWANAVFATVLNCIVSQTLIPDVSGEGRVLACEVLQGNSAIATAIKDGKHNNIKAEIEQGTSRGHQSLSRCLAELVRQKKITKEAAIAHSYDPEKTSGFLHEFCP